MMSTYIQIISFTFLIACLIQNFHRINELKRWFITALIFKIVGGIVFGLLYTYYYQGGDTCFFYQKAIWLSENYTLKEVLFAQRLNLGSQTIFQHPRNIFFVKVVYVLIQLFGSNYWVLTMVISVISMLCIWHFIDVLIEGNLLIAKSGIIALAIIPSVVIWTSGLLKETFMMMFICLGFASTLRLHRDCKSFKAWTVLILSCFFMFKFKYYVAIVWSPLMLLYLIISNFSNKKNALQLKMIYSFLLLALTWVLMQTLHTNLNYDYIFQGIYENHEALLKRTPVDNRIIFFNLRPDFISMIINTPLALYYGIFGSIWSFNNALQIAYSLENIVFVLFVIVSLWKLKKTILSYAALFLFFGAITLAIFISLSTPSIGTMSRYMVAYKPFIWVLTVYGGLKWVLAREVKNKAIRSNNSNQQ